MIVFLIFDADGRYKMTCSSEEAAENIVKTYGYGWHAKPVETNFGDKFTNGAIYTVSVSADGLSVRATICMTTERFGYTKGHEVLPYIVNYGAETTVTLMAQNAKDAIDKAMSVLGGKEEHI